MKHPWLNQLPRAKAQFIEPMSPGRFKACLRAMIGYMKSVRGLSLARRQRLERSKHLVSTGQRTYGQLPRLRILVIALADMDSIKLEDEIFLTDFPPMIFVRKSHPMIDKRSAYVRPVEETQAVPQGEDDEKSVVPASPGDCIARLRWLFYFP